MNTIDDPQRTASRPIVDFASVVTPIQPAPGQYNWRDDALCAQTDPNAFFPAAGEPVSAAKKVCVSCEVREQCLEYALANDEAFGVWGGLSAKERRRLLKKMAEEAEQEAA